MPMSRQQIQWGVLGAIAAAIGLLGVLQFLVIPLRQALRENREVTAAVRADVERMSREVGRGPDVQQRLAETRAALRGMAPWIPLPVLGNYLLPLEDQVRASILGLPADLEMIAEYDRLDLSAWNPAFKAFRIRLTARAGLDGVARCLYALQEQFPLGSLSALNIVPDKETPESHHVSLVLAWPIWADPAARPADMVESGSDADRPPAARPEPGGGGAP